MGAKKKARFNQTNEEFCVFVFGKPKIFRKISENQKFFEKFLPPTRSSHRIERWVVPDISRVRFEIFGSLKQEIICPIGRSRSSSLRRHRLRLLRCIGWSS
jgi:hypothetical protein